MTEQHITGAKQRYHLYSHIEDGLLSSSLHIKQNAIREIAKIYGLDTIKLEQRYDDTPAMTKLETFFHEALMISGSHHKQWYLEQVLQLEDLHVPYEYEKGIAP